MVIIDVVTDPPGGVVTFDGLIRGTAPISVEVYVPDPIDNFRDQCLSNGSVTSDWPTLRDWLESKKVGEFWWDLTFDERYSIAYMATSNELNFLIQYFKRDAGCGYGSYVHGGECASNTTIRCTKFDHARGCLPESGFCFWKKDTEDVWNDYADEKNYNIPCFFASTGVHVMAAIALNEEIKELRDLFIFQYDEIDIQPGSLQLPHDISIMVVKPDETTCVGKIGGTTVATIEIPELPVTVNYFREECMSGGSVTCDWLTLRDWLESKRVGGFWWGLTFDERYSIAHMATSNELKFFIQYFKRDAGCGYGPHVHDGECASNSAIRFTKFDHLMGCFIESGLCFWKKDDNDVWHDYADEKNYDIPCFFAQHTVVPGHVMMSIALNEEIKELRDLFIFQYDEIDIQPGDVQLPHGDTIEVMTPSYVGCTGSVDSTMVAEVDVP